MISLTEDNKMLGYELLLHSCPNISHFVTTRQGGVGEGNYASFNCTPYFGDEAEAVRRNREILCSTLPERPQELIIPFQAHGMRVGIITSAYPELTEEEKIDHLDSVDALVTNEQGCCICISTADCVPILLYDRRKKVIAVVHAGWRGTVGRIVKSTLSVMRKTYETDPKDLLACIGPSISLASFEVGDGVWQSFANAGFDMPRISVRDRQTHKWHIDLWEANRLQLLNAGVLPTNIELSGICTYINEQQFFSARRLGIRSGRILSGIMLNRNET